MYRIQTSRRWRFLSLATSAAVVGAMVIAVPQAFAAGPSVVTKSFSYTGSTDSFTVPPNITSLTITVIGGEGGNGGADQTPAAPPGGYRGVVTGTVAVTPGQVLTIGVGGGGATGASRVNSSAAAAIGGSNPLGGYAGGTGGKAGPNGSSGAGGAGGAASVVRIGGTDVVGAGGGGNGGSGQFDPTRGRTATGTYVGRTDTTSTIGQTGINANDACIATSCANNDGGGSGGGGGGSQGGAQGAIEFGAGSSNEWFGYGGSVGRNSTASMSGLTSSYQYYSDNGSAGSVVISYTTGSPAAPTAVSGTAGNASVNLVWTAPTDSGQSEITNYLGRYSSNGGANWTDVNFGTTGTTGTVTGLTNGTAYIFQVAAVNSVGTGLYSASSASVTPLGPPSAPQISGVTPQDGALGLTLVAPGSGAPVTAYDYRVNGGSWVTVASTSTSLVIPGLLNGTSYTVEVRAESSVGVGATSAPSSGTPEAVPGAPTISSLAVSNGGITVGFTPGFTGGGAITSYQYQLNGGSWVTAGSTSSPIQITGLAAGTTYAVALRAVNAVGAGASSTPASATTPALPGAPTISSAVIGDGTAQVRFAAGSTGGSPIEGYEYQTSAAGAWTAVPGGTSPLLLTGLTNGTTYTVKVRATNAVGTGPESSGYSVTPATVPSAPSIVGDTVAGGDQTLSAAFTPPVDNGGSVITDYQYSTDAGATWRTRTDGAGTASPVVISTLSSDGATLLTNGETYSVELRAVNAIGVGAASAVATGISQTVPSKPTITQVTASSGALGVTFTAGSNGGSAITSYEYSVGAGWTSTGTLGTSFVIDGLTNGTTYPVQVRAINAAGTGSASTAVNGTPVGLPGQATISSVVRSDRTLTASVSIADNGGSPVTAWQYSTDNGATWFTAPGTTSPLTLTVLSSDGSTRLANGTGYALQVRAVTAVGTGPASATTIVAPASAPAAPSIAVTPGNTTVTVTFALGNEGGSPVTQLEYSVDGGTSWVSAGTLSSPFTIGGLTNGTTYQVKLRADNAIGTGTASVAASATPRTVPGAPSSVTAVSNTSSADVAWAAPSDNGGAAVTGYTATAYSTSTSTTAVSSCTTTGATSCTIPSLTNGSTYYVAVTATNAAGTGAASSPRVLVTPLARPGAPTLNALTVGDGSITAPFTAGSAGDRAITGYQYSVDGGANWIAASGTSSPFTITGLTNGATYTVALRAVSAAGVGAMSNTRQATPYTYPSAPDAASIIANGGNGQITVSWPAANLNGGVLDSTKGYTATAFTDLTSGVTVGYCQTSTLSCVITGNVSAMVNGTTYYVSVQTLNSAGMYSVRSAPRVPATPNMKPGAPTGVGASSGNATATVVWVPPMSTGASPITSYQVWCSANGGTYTACGTPSATTSATITGLVNGSSYTFEVTATNGSGAGPLSTASSAVTPLAPGTTPVLTAAVSTVHGYTSTISNYDAATTYTASATNGATAVITGAQISVSGLAAGGSTTVTVSAAKTGYVGTQASVTGSALLAGVTPTFGTPTRTNGGFTFEVTNWDSSASYGVVATNGSVSITGSTVTVTGLAAGTGSMVTVTASKTGYADGVAAQSGTALSTGTTPTFSAATPLAGGYRFTITNYDASQTYTLAQADGGTATRVGNTVTVTGLGNGVTSGTTITASRGGYLDAVATMTGTSLPNGTAPVASAVTRTADGYRFTITPVDGTTFTVSSDAGTVVLSGSTVTVSGLTASASATVHVTASTPTALDASADVIGSALDTGIAPTLGSPTRTADGFRFQVTNPDPAGTYTVSTTDGSASISGSTVTVTDLAPGASSTVTVTVSHAGSTDASATQSGTALETGATPVLSAAVRTADGFTFEVMNLDEASSYAVVASVGSVTVSGSVVTVTGLAPGADSTVTVTASLSGYTDASATRSGTALLAGISPVLGTPTRTADGFTFEVTNPDEQATYTVSATDGAASISGSVVTVTGLQPGADSTVTVTVSRTDSTDASADRSGTALTTGVAPELGAPTRTADGFTFEVTNPDPAGTYTVSATDGSASISGSTVTVTGLAPAAASSVTVTVSHAGSTDASATQSGTALATGTTPALGAPTRTVDGFTFEITNLDEATSYTVVATDGTVSRSGSTVTVTGLAPSAGSLVTVTASLAGYTDASASASGSALGTGTVPAFSVPTRLAGGYQFTITNYDSTQTYTLVQADGGSAFLDAGTVTVSGLGDGVTSRTTVTASRIGYTDASGSVEGTSLAEGTAPVASDVTRTADGFTFTITLVPGTTFAVTTDAGSVVLLGSTVTVTGLTPGQAATVHVTASAEGALDATAGVSGTALLTGIVPQFSTPVRTADGFTFSVINHDPDSTYTVLASDGTATISGSVVTVRGLAPEAGSLVTMTVAHDGYTDATATQSGTALAVGTVPALSAVTPLAGGYRFTITNYDPSLTYTFEQSGGGTVTRDGDTVTVSGLGAGVTAGTTVTVAQAGHVDAVSTLSGTSLPHGTTPMASSPTSTADGFTFTIVMEPGVSYTVSSGEGTVVLSGSTVTVSGLAPGAVTTVLITGSTPTALDATATVSGSALLAGISPTFSSPVAAADGFGFAITNYSSAISYELSTTAGTVSRNGNQVTVTGLGASASASVHVFAIRSGWTSAGASVVGQSLTPTPTPGTPTPGAQNQLPTLSVQAPPPASAPTSTTTDPGVVPALSQLPESPAGTGAVTAGGTTVSSSLSTSGGTVTVAARNGLTFTVTAQQKGATLPLAPDGVVEVGPGGELWVTLSGFGRLSAVTFWSLGDMAQLGAGPTDGSGALAMNLVLPENMASGVRTIVVTGVDAQGKTVTMQVGIRVTGKPVSTAGPSIQDSWWTWSIVPLLLLLAGWWWFIVARKRRKDDEEQA